MKSWWKLRRSLSVLWSLRRPADLFLALRIFCVAAAVPALLRLKLPRLASLLEPKSMPPPADPDRVQKTIRFAEAVLLLGRPLVRPGCLTRGVTLYYFLRRSGVDVLLSFGIGTEEREFVGHCWLVKDGEPFLERNDPRPIYTEVFRLPLASSVSSHTAASLLGQAPR